MTHQDKDDFLLNDIFNALNDNRNENPYHEFGLLSNPFPSSGQSNPFPGICVDQDRVKEAFRRNLREIINDSSQPSRRLTLVGSTGAGKTNLLRYFEQQILWQQREQPTSGVFSVFIQQPQGGYFEIHRQIVSQVTALFFTPLLEAIRNGQIELDTLPRDLTGISPELIRVLRHVVTTNNKQLPLFNEYINPSIVRALDNWLQGVKLTTQDRNDLGKVSTDIAGSTIVAVKYLADLFRLLHHAKLYKVVVILFDEFEEIVSGTSSSAQSKYTQDLRNLLDSLDTGVFFIVGTAPIMGQLEQVSPALARRLSDVVEINPISTVELALTYTHEYLSHGRRQFRENKAPKNILNKAQKSEANVYFPFSEDEVREIYKEVSESTGGTVVPGDFLPILNRKLYHLAYGEN